MYLDPDCMQEMDRFSTFADAKENLLLSIYFDNLWDTGQYWNTHFNVDNYDWLNLT